MVKDSVVVCPSCGSVKTWKAGLRLTKLGDYNFICASAMHVREDNRAKLETLEEV